MQEQFKEYLQNKPISNSSRGAKQMCFYLAYSMPRGTSTVAGNTFFIGNLQPFKRSKK